MTKVIPPNKVRLSCEGTWSYSVAPKKQATDGKNKAPQKVRVTEMASVIGGTVDCKARRSGTDAKEGKI
jgi:hypothetical protein